LLATWNAIRDGMFALMRPGDHVDRRTLRREDEMNPGRARLLGDPRDQFFDLLPRHHHQVGEFIDDDDDQMHLVEHLRRIRA
jgi:hypothetical protein